MLKSSPGPSSKGPQNVSIVLFSIGGQRLAAKADEVGGIWPWTPAVPIPSGTPHVSAVLRRGADVLPVFDLAGKLGREVDGAAPFCLIVRHADGPLAIRIDGAMPTLQSVETTRIRPSPSPQRDATQMVQVDQDDVPMYALTQLGRDPL